MTIQALLLDAGGTLLSENPSRDTLYAQAAARHGLALAPEDMRQCMQRAHGALPLVLEGNYRYSMPWFEAFIGDIFARQLGLERTRLPRIREMGRCRQAFGRESRLSVDAQRISIRTIRRGMIAEAPGS